MYSINFQVYDVDPFLGNDRSLGALQFGLWIGTVVYYRPIQCGWELVLIPGILPEFEQGRDKRIDPIRGALKCEAGSES